MTRTLRGLNRTYSTTFPSTEDPISESGKWTGGTDEGSDWHDCKTTTNKAFGKQTTSTSTNYDDSVAILKGAWSPNQEVSAVVANTDSGGDWNAEVEFHLRSEVRPGIITGYEITYSANSAHQYCGIVRWNGPFNGGSYWTDLTPNNGISLRVNTGDVCRATASGNVITMFLNGSQLLQVTDSTHPQGAPGIGFYKGNIGASGDSTAFGFSSFTATSFASRTLASSRALASTRTIAS